MIGTRQIFKHFAFEYAHLLLRLRKCSLTIARQFKAALVRAQGLLEAELPLLHAADDTFQLGERRFEIDRVLC